MSKHLLTADLRTLSGRKVKQLRHQGLLPANVYGKDVASLSVQLSAKAFEKLYAEAGDTGLIDLQVAGESKVRPVMVVDLGLHPVTDKVLHVDLRQVNLKEKITATVPVEVIGEAEEAIKLGNVVVQILDSVEVEALPTDFPEKFEVDVTALTEVGEAIQVKDLKIDTSKVTIQTDPEEIIVKVEAPQAEEVVEAATPETEFVHGAEKPEGEEVDGEATKTSADTKDEE